MKNFVVWFGILAGFQVFLPSSGAAQSVIRTVYDATLMGLPISKTTVEAKIENNKYAISVQGRTSRLVSIVKSAEGQLNAEGDLTGSVIDPKTFHVNMKGGSTTYDIDLNFAKKNITSEKVEPPPKPAPDLVPLKDDMRKGVMDPLSALMIVLDGKPQQSVCLRNLPVYTGRERFDVTLGFKREEDVEVDNFYKGKAVVCSAIYKPIGGHRSEKKEIKSMAESKDMEMWFVPVPNSDFMALYRVVIGTKLGQFDMVLTKASVTNPSKAQN